MPLTIYSQQGHHFGVDGCTTQKDKCYDHLVIVDYVTLSGITAQESQRPSLLPSFTQEKGKSAMMYFYFYYFLLNLVNLVVINTSIYFILLLLLLFSILENIYSANKKNLHKELLIGTVCPWREKW